MIRRTFLQALASVLALLGLAPSSVASPEAGRRPSVPKFKAGDMVVCPKCGDKVATAMRDIFGSEVISSVPWQWHQEHWVGDQMRCRGCGAHYSRFLSGGLQLHTLRGWA